MAYGLKYDLWCASKDGFLYKLKLKFDGYIGAEIQRDIPADSPLVLRKDKSAVIKGTSCEFGIREIVDFEMDEFYTNNPKKIKAELYQGANLIWAGYNLPQQYQADYVSAPLSIRFTATDGLGLLKNEKFNLTGRNSQLATIIYCIDKIGLGLSYSIAINLFETNHAHDRSPLAQTYEDASCYNGKYCNQVIEKILDKYDAEITQINGVWQITRSVDKKSTRMLYTSAGVYTGTESAPVVLDLGYKGTGIEAWPVGRLSRTLEPGAKKATLSFDFGRKASFLNNYDFWRFSGGQFENWTQNGSYSLEQRIKEGKAYAFLQGYTSDANECISQEIPLTKVTDEDFVFEIDFAALGCARSTLTSGTIMMAVKMLIALGDGVNTYFLTKKGWSTTLTFIEETVQSSIATPVWNKVKIITGEPPISGTLAVFLYRYYSLSAPRPTETYIGVVFSEPLVYMLRGGELYPSGLKTVATFDDSTEPDDLGEVSLLVADAPDYDNKAQLYKNITRLSDDTPTALWHVLGEALNYSLVVQLARVLASNNRVARQKLTGDLRGTGISFNSIISHAYNNNREFEISEGQWDIYKATYQVTLLELLAWNSETITFSDEDVDASSSSNQSSGKTTLTGSVFTNDSKALPAFFEVVNDGTDDEYLRVKIPIACDLGIMAYANSGQLPPSIWDSLPVASDLVAGVVKVGAGLSIADGVLSAAGSYTFQYSVVNNAGAVNLVGDVASPGNNKMYGTDGSGTRGWLSVPSSMVYPGAGIPVSTGSAWGASITNNSANWNTAFGWGDWASNFGVIAGKICQGNDSRLSDSRSASDVYAWAKAAIKPSYNATEVGLGNVTNESKATMFASPTFTGTMTLPGTFFKIFPAQASPIAGMIGIGDGTGWELQFVKNTDSSVKFFRLKDNGDLYLNGNLRVLGSIAAYSGSVPGSWWNDMPYATASAVGGIKVGSGLSINASTGVLSVNFTGYATLASPLFTGTVKVGTIGGSVPSGGIKAENWVGAVSGNKIIYLYTEGTYAKLDAYDYGAGVAMNFALATNGGNVSIGTLTATEKLYVQGNIYTTANCSALSFTDRTPFYEGDALSEIMKIAGKDGEIDHDTLPEFVRREFVRRVSLIESMADNGSSMESDSLGILRQDLEGLNQSLQTLPEPTVVKERDLGAMISMLTVAVQQITKRLETLESA